jgi:peptide/nickel transport system permease protein
MWRYILKRIGYFIPTILGACLLAFIIVRLIPGDPVEIILGIHAITPEIRTYYQHVLGLDQPIYVQFIIWFQRMLTGDWGTSIISGLSVRDLVFRRFINTLQVTLIAIIFIIIIGTILGIISANKTGTRTDKILRVFSILGWSLPDFLTGLIFILIFSLYLNILPSMGGGGIEHLILPSLTLSIGSIAYVSRITRGSLLDVAVQDFVRTARAKGLSKGKIMINHILRNALLPIITILGMEFGWLLSGSFIVETIFSYPGIGGLTVQSISNRDFTVVQGCVFFIAIILCTINLIIDIIYVYLDPRVRYERRS